MFHPMRLLVAAVLAMSLLLVSTASAGPLTQSQISSDDGSYWRDLLSLAADGERAPIMTFPGALYMPPQDSDIFSSLAVDYASWNPDHPFGDGAVSIIVLRSPRPGDGVAGITGALGRDLYARMEAEMGAAVPGTEYVADLNIQGRPAILKHAQGLNGENWAISWYDPEVNESHVVDLSTALLARAEIDGDVPTVARALADRVSQFVLVKSPVSR